MRRLLITIYCLANAIVASAMVHGQTNGRSVAAVNSPAAAEKLFRDGEFQKAEKALLSTLSQKPAGFAAATPAASLGLLATIYQESGQYTRAIEMGRRYQQLLERIKEPDP